MKKEKAQPAELTYSKVDNVLRWNIVQQIMSILYRSEITNEDLGAVLYNASNAPFEISLFAKIKN